MLDFFCHFGAVDYVSSVIGLLSPKTLKKKLCTQDNHDRFKSLFKC